MDWMAKAAWVQRNCNIDTDKLNKIRRYGIKVVYIDLTSENMADQLLHLRGAGVNVGAYFASSWWKGISTTEYASRVSTLLNRHLPRANVEAPPCMLDFEEMPVKWVHEVLLGYRSRQPVRPTALTDEPFQGGVLPWTAVKNAKMPYYAQLYLADMTAADGAAVVLEAARYYGDPNMVHPFYDGAHWGTDHRDGCYFTLERMP